MNDLAGAGRTATITDAKMGLIYLSHHLQLTSQYPPCHVVATILNCTISMTIDMTAHKFKSCELKPLCVVHSEQYFFF